MNGLTAFLLVLAIITVLVIILMIAKWRGDIERQKEKKKKVLDLPIQLRKGVFYLVTILWFILIIPIVAFTIGYYSFKFPDKPLTDGLLLGVPLILFFIFLIIYLFVITPFIAKLAVLQHLLHN